MFWDIFILFAIIVFIALVLFTLPVIIFIIGYIFDIDLSEKFERKHPKFYKFWERTLLSLLILTLFTYFPFSIHHYIEKQKKMEDYKVYIDDDNIKVIDKNGRTYLIDIEINGNKMDTVE